MQLYCNVYKCAMNSHTSCCWNWSMTRGCWLSCGCCQCSAPGWALDSAGEGWPEPLSSSHSPNWSQTARECCLFVKNIKMRRFRCDKPSGACHSQDQHVFITFVPPLFQRWLFSIVGVPAWLHEARALLLEVPTAVPAVGVLGESLGGRLGVDAFGVSNGGSEKEHTI